MSSDNNYTRVDRAYSVENCLNVWHLVGSVLAIVVSFYFSIDICQDSVAGLVVNPG